MPISDSYVVRYLLTGTLAHGNPLIWQEKDGDTYTVSLHGVDVELSTVRDRSGPRVFLTFSAFPEQIDVGEPINKGLFRDKYDSDDDEDLAHLLRELASAVARQCSQRSERNAGRSEVIRESIYRRLIGAEDAGN